MVDSNLVIILKDFVNDKFDIREFVSFIKGVPRLKILYQICTQNFLKILREHTSLITRYSTDVDKIVEQYSSEEAKIINNITKNYLHFFYVLYCVDNGEDIITTENDIFRNFAIYFSLDNNNLKNLIDYIIKFGVYTNAAATVIKNVKLTPTEVEILKCVNQNMNRQAIAKHLVVSPHTVDTHKKNIAKKIIDTNIELYNNYKGDERLRQFAGMYFA